ncbi:DUF5400 family protein [Methanosphaerula subterraneus]|uniref:DUF5400 family protein n=1 Tax=Methanosphaerula subterraneus TaxID=3350244 RepID=UPI003F85EB07
MLVTVTAYALWSHVRYNFQTTPVYALHLALVTMLPVLMWLRFYESSHFSIGISV